MTKTRSDNRSSTKGLVWDIQRFNFNDGDGIRTIVFLKGCPLHCLWCSNPEGMNSAPELQVFASRCIHSGSCQAACPQEAITYASDLTPKIDRHRCNMCGKCIESCPSGALAIVGKYMTVAKVLNEVRKDSAFFWRSRGGVTISGGEPSMQDEFLQDLLIEANDINIHTAIETCGYVRWAKLEKLVPYTDTFLYDIKHMDSNVHKDLTGVHNEIILENARRIAQCSKGEIVIRTPIIPGKNDDIRNLVAIAEYAAHLNVKRWDLIPYHRLGESKYKQIGKDYPLERIEPPNRERMMKILAFAKDIFPRVMIENE